MNTQNENKDVQMLKLIPNQDGWKSVEVNKEKIQIPPIWDVKNTGSISTVVTGNTPSTQNGLYWNPADESGIPWFSTPDFRNTTKGVVIKSKKNLTNLGAQKSRLCPNGTVMVSCIATIGEVAIAGQECTFNQQINGILPGKEHSPEYLRQAILHNKNTLLGMAANSVVQIINKTTFELYEVVLPPLPEQQRIASVLTSQESRIEDLRTWAQTERDRLTWLTDELLSGRVRVVERIGEREVVVEQNADGQVVEGLGAYELVANQDGWKSVEVNGIAKCIPITWSITTYHEAAEFINGDWGSTPTSFNEGVVCYRKADYQGNYIKEGNTRRVSKRNPFVSRLDTIIEKSGGGDKNPVGSPALVVSSEPAICSNFMVCAKTKEGYNPLLFFFQYKKLYESDTINTLFQQTTGIQNLQMGDLKNLPYTTPPHPEQQRIAAVLSAQERQIADIDQLIELERQRLSWLTDELLSGRVRVVENT